MQYPNHVINKDLHHSISPHHSYYYPHSIFPVSPFEVFVRLFASWSWKRKEQLKSYLFRIVINLYNFLLVSFKDLCSGRIYVGLTGLHIVSITNCHDLSVCCIFPSLSLSVCLSLSISLSSVLSRLSLYPSSVVSRLSLYPSVYCIIPTLYLSHRPA